MKRKASSLIDLTSLHPLLVFLEMTHPSICPLLDGSVVINFSSE